MKKIMSLYTYNGTSLEDNINTFDLQNQFPSVTSGFEVNGLAGDDTIVSSFIGRNGVDDIDGGEGNDLMSVYPSYLTPLPITNYVNFFGGFGTDHVYVPRDRNSQSVSNFSISNGGQIHFTVRGYNGEVTEVYVNPTVETLTIGDLAYLTEDIMNGRVRTVEFDELYARSYNENSDWAVKGLDTYTEYHSSEPEPVDPLNGDNIINSARGKGKLKGGAGADEFRFDVFDSFKKKSADKIINFNSSEGDFLSFTPAAIPGLDSGNDNFTFASASSKKQLKKLSKRDYDFVYFEKKGCLYYDGNGSQKNWGDSSEGGLIAIMQGKPNLTLDDITIIS